MKQKAYEKWQEKLQLLHDESCKLGAKCPGREGKMAVASTSRFPAEAPLDSAPAGVQLNPEVDVSEVLHTIDRLLGDWRAAVAQLRTAIELEGPDAGKPRATTMLSERIEALAGTRTSWPATNKSAAPELPSARLAPTQDLEKARRQR